MTIAPSAALAAVWKNTAGGDWQTPSNWQPNTVPSTTGDNVASFNRNAAYTVTFSANASVTNLYNYSDAMSLNLYDATAGVSRSLLLDTFTINGTTPAAGPSISISGGSVSTKAAYIGVDTASGTLNVSGVGASFSSTANSLLVGYNKSGTVTPQGTLNVSSGATVSGRGIYLGYYGGTAQATVDGAGSTLTATGGSLYVGTTTKANAGDTQGSLTVTNGGAISTVATVNTAVIGDSGAVGTIKIQGANSTWTHRGSIYVGGSGVSSLGTGTLEISNGGKVAVTDSTNPSVRVFNNGGTLKLSGSTSQLSVESMDLGNNAANFQFTGGTLRLSEGQITNVGSTPLSIGGTLTGTGSVGGNVALTSSGAIVVPATAGQALAVSGNITGTGTLRMPAIGVNGMGKLYVYGNASFGTIDLNLATGYSPAIGQSFDLLDVIGGTLGSGYTFDFADAVLGPGKQWNTSAFAATGSVSVEKTPEPGTILLAVLAGSPLLLRRRQASAGGRSPL